MIPSNQCFKYPLDGDALFEQTFQDANCEIVCIGYN